MISGGPLHPPFPAYSCPSLRPSIFESQEKKYRKAIRAYDKALKLYPGDPWAMQNRALAEKAEQN